MKCTKHWLQNGNQMGGQHERKEKNIKDKGNMK